MNTDDLVEQLRDLTADWNGSALPDAADTRVPVKCGEIRALLDEIERLRNENEGIRKANADISRAAANRRSKTAYLATAEQRAMNYLKRAEAAETELARLRAPAGDVGEIAKRLEAAYEKVKQWPEKSPTGFMGLLELRNIVPAAADLIQRLAGQVAEAERVALINAETLMKMNREIVAGHDRLREAVEVMREIAAMDYTQAAINMCATRAVESAKAFLSTLEPTNDQ